MQYDYNYIFRIVGYIGLQSYTSATWQVSMVNSSVIVPYLSTSVVSSTSFNVSWNPPAPPYSTNLIGYQLWMRYDVAYNGYLNNLTQDNAPLFNELFNLNSSSRIELSANVNSFEIRGCFLDSKAELTHCIAPWTYYIVFLIPVFETFVGESISTLIRTGEGAPPSITHLRQTSSTSTTVTISWSLVLPLQSSISEIRIVVKENSSKNIIHNLNVFVDVDDIELNDFIKQITDLQPFMQYEVTLACYTNNDIKGPSRSLVVQTGDSIPSQMSAIQILSDDGDVVELEWTAPSPLPGIILRYEVGVHEGSIIIYSGLSLSVTVSKTQYSDFRVRAVTSLGAGPWSEAAADAAKSADSLSMAQPEVYGSVIVVLVIAVILLGLSAYWYRNKKFHEKQVEVFVTPPVDEWEISSESLTIGEELGKGSFGVVAAGQVKTKTKGGGCEITNVAVKMCKADSTVDDKRSFLAEANLMKSFSKPSHSNVSVEFRLLFFVLHLQTIRKVERIR